MSHEEMYMAMAALVGEENICLRMLAPREWVVKFDRITLYGKGAGDTMPVSISPMEAVEQAWQVLTGEGVYVITNPQNKKRHRDCYRWNGFMWQWIPEPVKRQRGGHPKGLSTKPEQTTETPAAPPVVPKNPPVGKKAANPPKEAPQQVPEFCEPCQEVHKGADCRFALEGKCGKWLLHVQGEADRIIEEYGHSPSEDKPVEEQAAEKMGERRNEINAC